jgi:FkbM family methyltransferase
MNENGISDKASLSLDAEDLVKALYRTLLLREPDEIGLKAHLSQVRNGGSLENMLLNFVTSPEFSIRFSEFYHQHLSASETRFVLDNSQHGEIDLLVRQIINSAAKHRVVVDVGAKGREGSNSYDLLRNCRWKGLLIEANPALIPVIEKNFSGFDVKVVHCAVSDSEGKGVLHIGVNDGVSSLTEATAKLWGDTRGKVEVPIRRLGSILKENNIPHDFDLLSLDIEGEDIRVMNDLIGTTSYQPCWVIIEASWGFATKRLEDVPFSEAVRQLYSLADQTTANLILRRRF